MSPVKFLESLGLALLLGSIIGAERQWRHKAGGLKTNALVALGASLFVLFSVMLPGPKNSLQVAAQVVTGIGFLGAGLIMREGLNVRGLNTAASLWCSAAVGVLCGGSYYADAVIGACAVLVVNVCLTPLSKFIGEDPDRGAEAEYEVRLQCKDSDEPEVRRRMLQLLHGQPLVLKSLAISALEPDAVEIQMALSGTAGHLRALEHLTALLVLEHIISKISWNKIPNHE